MKRWLQRPNEYVSSFCAAPSRFRQSITGVRCRGWRSCISEMLLWYFHLAGSLFWPPPAQSRPIAFLCYQLCGHSRALSSWPLDPSGQVELWPPPVYDARTTLHTTRPTPPLHSLPGHPRHGGPGLTNYQLLAPPQPAGPPWWWFSQQPKRDRSATWWRGKILFRPTVQCLGTSGN